MANYDDCGLCAAKIPHDGGGRDGFTHHVVHAPTPEAPNRLLLVPCTHDPHAGPQGLTLRDHFAMAALPGLTAEWWDEVRNISATDVAAAAYSIADMMLAARLEKKS